MSKVILRKKPRFSAPIPQKKEELKKVRDPKSVYRLFAICPGGLDEVLKKEIEALPAKVTAMYPGGIEFEGTLETAYLANLKLRTASRVLLMLKSFKKIFKPEELYVAVQEINWGAVFSPNCTLAIYLTESNTKERRIPVNPQFWALKAKDSIVDQFRKSGNERPNIDREDPDITIRLHLHDQLLKVYLDLSGPSLHERGYRAHTLDAPMKENLAAGLLLLAGWDRLCKEGYAFYDPFCGSGTILIEAAMIATNTAPGLLRTRFGFFSWLDHDAELFEAVHARLKGEQSKDFTRFPIMMGSDRDKAAVMVAEENLKRAKLLETVRLKISKFEDTHAIQEKGLIVSNPPYGVRLNEVDELKATYQAMGATFKHHYKGWRACVITSEKTLIHQIGLKPSKKWALHNGGLESQFSIFSLY
jgi:23S rRNA (guanine2445-N2)-methyltransferase / 23S rRNA (guanine2069-N7)-methyltransferase